MIRKHRTLLFVVLSIAFISSFLVATPALAGTEHNVYGWAWSSNVGWISFNNCANPTVPNSCSGINYGVSIATSTTGGGKITGYAWSPTIGWIRFGGLDPYASGGDKLPTTTNNARSDAFLLSNNQVTGWARACEVYASGCSGTLKSKAVDGSDLGGWDGWISLKGYPGYGITKSALSTSGTLTTSALRGFAWGALNLGWIKFDPLTSAQAASANGGCPGVCMVTTTTTNPPPPPVASAILSVVKVGNGAGNVTGTGISCGADCSESFTITSPASKMALTASAISGSTFDGWFYAAGTSNTCSLNGGTVNGTSCTNITMNTSKTVYARFSSGTTPPPPSGALYLTVNIKGKGTVEVFPFSGSGGRVGECTSDSDSGKSCSINVSTNTSYQLDATAGTGYNFSSWSGHATSTSPEATISMGNANKTVRATFITTSVPPVGSCETATIICTKTKDGYLYPCSHDISHPIVRTANALTGVPYFTIVASQAGVRLQASENTSYPSPYYSIFKNGSGDRLTGEFSVDNGSTWSEGPWVSTNGKLSVIFRLKLTSATSSLTRLFNLERSVNGTFCESSEYPFQVISEGIGTKAIP